MNKIATADADDFYASPAAGADPCALCPPAQHGYDVSRAVGARLRQVRRRFAVPAAEFCTAFGIASLATLDAYECEREAIPPQLSAQLIGRLHIHADYLMGASEQMYMARTMSCAGVALRLNDGYVPHLFVWDADLTFQLILEKPLYPSARLSSILPVDCIASLESSRDRDMACVNQLCEMLVHTNRMPRDMIWHFGDPQAVTRYLQDGVAPGRCGAMPEDRRVLAHRRLWSYFLRHIGPAQMRRLMEEPRLTVGSPA